MTLNLDRTAWSRVGFGDVVKNVNETVRDLEAAGVDRIIAMEHMDPGELEVARWGSTADGTTFTRRVRPGQTLFGKRRAYQRKVAYAEFDAICSGDIYTFEADPEHMLGEFLPFLVQSDPFFDHALGTSAGSLSPRTNWRDLANFEFDLPHLEDQRRIAELMWAVEHAQASLQRLSARAEEVRAVRADGLLASVEETHGRALLAELVREPMTDGVREKGPSEPSGVPYVRVTDMTRLTLSAEGMLTMAPELASANRASLMRSGDLVMALRSKIGMCHVVPAELDGCNIAQGVAKIAPDPDKVEADYLFEVLAAPRTQAELDRLAKGTTIREVGLRALRAYAIPYPVDSAVRAQVSGDLRAIRASIAMVDEEFRAVRQIRAGLLAGFFGGR